MQALKVSAMGLLRSKSALGAYCRRMAARMDKPKALKATAHKLARLVYTLLTQGQEYVDRGQDYYEQRYRKRVVTNLQRRANELGFTLIPNLQAV
jgi:acyl transferase domain-containing protein